MKQKLSTFTAWPNPLIIAWNILSIIFAVWMLGRMNPGPMNGERIFVILFIAIPFIIWPIIFTALLRIVEIDRFEMKIIQLFKSDKIYDLRELKEWSNHDGVVSFYNVSELRMTFNDGKNVKLTSSRITKYKKIRAYIEQLKMDNRR